MKRARTVITPAMTGEGSGFLPMAMLRSMWGNRNVIRQLGARRVEARHRGSILGIGWTVLNPLLLLGVYTFVFTVLLKVGGNDAGSRTAFAIEMFTGMVLFSVFADTLSGAPQAIVGKPNYVKKVVFPLAALPAAELYASFVLAGASTAVLFLAILLTQGLTWTAVAFPLVLPPLALLTMGAAWFIASLSVFIRDVATSIGVIVTMLFFLTPVFWRVRDWPEASRDLVWLNPLAILVESARDCLLRDSWPNLTLLAACYVVAIATAQLGWMWFQRSKRGFADAL
ncbi:MAG: ABC transporter permease [Planctomycetota bacterium]